MEPHILGCRPLMLSKLRLIYFLFLRLSLKTSMCSLWPPLSSLWPPLSSLWPPLSSLWPPLSSHWLLQNVPRPLKHQENMLQIRDGGVSLSCRTSLSRLKKTDCRTENGDECKEGYRRWEIDRTGNREQGCLLWARKIP
ncbi:unnamed protein product [Gadus morhua 'NCC']